MWSEKSQEHDQVNDIGLFIKMLIVYSLNILYKDYIICFLDGFLLGVISAVSDF